MLLDYNAGTDYFFLRIGRAEGVNLQSLMASEGWDFSQPASSASEAIMMTRDPYAASCYWQCATPQAYAKFSQIISEVKASWAVECSTNYRCPADKELWPYQRADLAYAVGRRNTLVGDQPGLGKTPVAICFANEIRAKRVLAVVPANIRLQWAKRVREWSTLGWNYIVHPITNGSRGVHPTAEWNIVSYDLARTPAIGAALARGRYDLLILDECHYLKNIDTNRTHAIFGDHTGFMRKPMRDDSGEISGYEELFEALASRSERILGLTGTLLPNRPREAYTLCRGLCHDAIDWASEDRFKARYNPSARIKGKRKDGTEYTYTREEVGRSGELNHRLRANFMVRHEKRGPNGVLNQLKYPKYDIIVVEDNAAIKQALDAESMLQIDPDDPDILRNADMAVQGQIAIVRHLMGMAIAPVSVEYCEQLLEGGEDKLCIFGWHHDVLDYHEHKLSKYGVLRIDGRTSAGQKEARRLAFINQPGLRILIGNMQSVGTGTDGLQEVCSHVVFPEYDWTPGNNSQAVERLDRPGQTRTVLADFIVARKSLGERMLSSALRKLQDTSKVLDARYV